MRRAGWHLALAALLGALLGGVAVPELAAAQGGPAGAVHAHVLASPREDFGGAVSAELTVPLGIFRLGGFLAVAAVPSPEDVYNRIFLPVGPTVGLEVLGQVLGFALRVRGGLWAGATQDVKLTAGGFVGGGAYLLFALGGGATLSAGLDVWGVFGDGETALFAPGIGLTWGAPVE
jgi:hypothetical protein